MVVLSCSRILVVALGAALIAADSSAQSLLLPSSHATQSGTGSTNMPFGRSTPARVQIVYDGSLFGAQSFTLSALDFRIDEGAAALGKLVELEIRASSLGRSVTQVQSGFAANRGIDETVVFGRQLFDLPAAGSGTSPNSLDVTIPLDTSFTFHPSGGALVLELVVFGQAPGSYPLDTSFVCQSPRVGYGPAGCGPVAGGPTLKADSVTDQLTWGGPLTMRVYDAAPGAMTALLFGFMETGVWRGLTIPFDLSVIGATGCSLSIDVIVSQTGAADATGTAYYGAFLPSQPELVGEWFRFQGVSIQPGANALGVLLSQPHKVQVCGWEAVARVFAAGTSATSGLREIGVAPVVQLR